MTERERQIKMRISWFNHVKKVTGNVAKICRYYGISRKTYYKWYDRYLEKGTCGLVELSRRPFYSPEATKAEIVEKIIYLRQHYHFGPTKIHMYLYRYHNIKITPSGIYLILKRLKMNKLHTAIDDCTRIRINMLFQGVHTIQTDNGSEFGCQFHWHVLDIRKVLTMYILNHQYQDLMERWSALIGLMRKNFTGCLKV